MNNNLNLLYAQDSDINGSNSFTELRISSLQEPILENNEIENLNPNYENIINYQRKDLNTSKSDSKNSLFSSDVKISYRTELFQEIENNNIKKVSEILNKNITQLNEYNIDGLTPLHLGVIKGNAEMINLLLEKGANPNALSLSKNQTPLHLSYINQNEESDKIIKDLINHGAKENLLDINHKKPCDYLYINVNTSNSNLSKKKINLNKRKLENNLKLNNGNIENGNENIEKNLSETNSYENTIIQSISTHKEKSGEKYIKTSLDEQKKINVDINDLITPIKYPCLAKLKEESQKDEKSSINDSLENSKSDNRNKPQNNNFPNLQENDIKMYKTIQSTTSYNDIVDLTYTTSMVVDQSNKKSSIQKESKNNEAKQVLFSSNKNINKKIDYKQEGTNVDEILKELIMKKRDSIAKTYRKKANNVLLYGTRFNNSEKNKKILYESYNILNKDVNNNSMKNLIIIHNTTPNYCKKLNKTRMEYSGFSTDNQTGKRKLNYHKDDNDLIDNKYITEFHYDNTEEDNNINENITSLANEVVNNTNNLKDIDNNINNSYNIMKRWLKSIELQNYFDNFVNNDIYDVNQLINRMKSNHTRLGINDIESLLKIDKKGYSYRILVKLEADAGIIEPKITKFMLKDVNIFDDNDNKSINNLRLSISNEYKCFGCCKINFLKSEKKNDLKCFLLRYGLMDLYQNFYHNGFDLINYVILQMYSDNPLTDDILENNFHIYNYERRSLLLKALMAEMKKINFFLSSNEYNNSQNKDIIKYENIIFEDKKEYKSIYYGQTSHKNCNDCMIF